MCGIAGFVGFPDGAELARAANRLQLARGPDAQQVWSDGYISLAHQRLAIIDLDPRSDQPMHKHGLVIVFNGEIYNHRQLRRQLEVECGARFATESDTEVVLEAFRHWGADCLQRFEGMFAFAIWNPVSRRLFLARDPFGIKPLFYLAMQDRFAFGSELKVLLRALPHGVDINAVALQKALYYQWVPGNESCIAGIHKLPPAHWLELDADGRARLTRYWQITDSPAPAISEREAVDTLDRVLCDSVQRHMVADVEVGAFLSGGIDSSLICVLAAAHNPRLRTFTIATDAAAKRVERMPADEVHARRLAAQFGFLHHEHVIRPDIVTLLPQAVSWLDEPIGDPAAINTYLISRQARDAGIKVLLSGMGADELFFGYRRQKATLMALRYQTLPRSVRTAIDAVVFRLPVRVAGRGQRTVRWARKFLSFANMPLEGAYRTSYAYYDRSELNDLFPCPDHEQMYDELVREHAALFESRFTGDPVNQMCHTDIHMFMAGLNLTYTDRASMAASVEVRVPFIDKAVVELAMRLPGALKYRHGQSKYLLKRVAERYLPRRIVYRPKASFGAPIRAWISGPLAGMVGDLLSRERIVRRGLFDPGVVAAMIDADRAGRADYAYRIYQLLTIELWMQQYVDAPRGG